MNDEKEYIDSEDRDNLSDHDLLLCLDVKLSELKIQFSNHLKHHEKVSDRQWAVTIAALTAGFMGLASFGVALLLLLTKVRVG